MKKDIIEIIERLSYMDEYWEENIELLGKKIQHVHPDIYELLQSNSIEEIYELVVNYKPLILNPINDKKQLEDLYNDSINYNQEKFSCEEMIYFLELAFGEFNSDYIYSPSNIEEDREEPFSFEEFYQLWLDKKLK